MSINRPLSRLFYSRLIPRPCVRPRYPCARLQSTEAKHPTVEHGTRATRIPRRYIWYLLFLGLGVGVGFTVRAIAAPRLDPPVPGSEEDEIALHALADQLDELDIVKKMRAQGYHLHDDTPLDQSKGRKRKGGWIELDIKRNMTETPSDGNRTTRTLTHTAMAGVQGLGVQRAFWNSETRELVAVVWIGSRLSGWPGVAHGGAIATIFEDAMSRMIAGPNVPIDSIPTPNSLSVTYARPTLSFNIYVLRASLSKPDLPQDRLPSEPMPAKSWLPYWKDFTKKWTSAAPDPAMEISGTLESLDGEVKVRAKGIWPASAFINGNV